MSLPDSGDDIYKPFFALVLKSPIAVATLGLATFCGYGISFILFDYRRQQVKKSHFLFHTAVGLGYAAIIFCVVNFDLLSRDLTMDQFGQRMPFTFLISFACAFVIMIGGAIWRERSTPYSSSKGTDSDDGN